MFYGLFVFASKVVNSLPSYKVGRVSRGVISTRSTSLARSIRYLYSLKCGYINALVQESVASFRERIGVAQIVERSVKQLNTYGNRIGVLVTREAKAINLKSGSRVQVSAVKEGKKEYIIIEKFPLAE